MESYYFDKIELFVKYHKIDDFVLSFTKLKLTKQPWSGFRNPKLKTTKKTWNCLFEEWKRSFSGFHKAPQKIL